jgi:K(+)-stimulated pyrophosphate-energized sodium pump
MVLIALLVSGTAAQLTDLMSLPLIIGGVCILTSIIGTYFVRLGRSQSIMGALYKGFWTTALLSIPAIYYVMAQTLGDMNAVIGGAREAVGPEVEAQVAAAAGGFTGMDLFWCMLVGLAVTALLVWITEYYTGTNFRPVRSIAKASETGHGTNVIQGLAISLESTAMPTLVICIGIIVSYQLAGLIGIAFAATAMLALAGMVVALDAYGPVTDNAGGIAEMAGMEDEVPPPHRRPRRGRQHHQGRHQGLRHWFGGACGLVLFAPTRPTSGVLERTRHRPRRRRFLALQPLCWSSACCSARFCPTSSERWA